MSVVVLLFFVGVLATTQFKEIPSLTGIILLSLICFLLLWLGDKNIRYQQLPLIRYICIPIIGCLWAFLHARYLTSWNIPTIVENQPLEIQGYVSSIPVTKQQNTSFDINVIKIGDKVERTKLRASCYQCPYPFRVGDSWRFVGRLKRTHSLRNPSCFDLEKTYFHRRLRGHVSIIQDKRTVRLPSSYWHAPIERLRQYIRTRLLAVATQNPLSGIMLALTLGMTDSISATQWRTFRLTGTSHLIAISGLHIGLAAGMIAKIVGWIWNRLPYGPLFIPTIQVEVSAGLVTATIYSLLAGLSASTQRSLLMITFYFLAMLCKRKTTTLRSLLFALGIMLVLQPFVILNIGFWLSFLAVFLLIYGMSARLAKRGFLVAWLLPQWLITVGMAPTSLLFFQQASLLAIPANMVAIPWFSLLVIPCFLLGTVLSWFARLSSVLLQMGLGLLALIWCFLEKIASCKSVVVYYAIKENIINAAAHFGAYLMLLPVGIFPRVVSMLWWLPGVMQPQTLLPANAFQLVVFDVGQGLATLVKTQNHVLIFDTGARFSEDFDMGKAVVVPYLIKMGVKKIDILTVSHGDNDHIGGANSILETMTVNKIYSSVPEKFTNNLALRCKDQIQWQWDGVRFSFLSPNVYSGFTGNNSSCVLRVSNGKQSVLLTGDIEKQAERYLLMQHAKDLPATILVVPHHGSKTSSSAEFLAAVAPHYAIFSTGYLNTFHHPHQEIVRRYLDRKTKLFNTVSSGAITMTLLPNSDKVTIEEYRNSQKRIWHKKLEQNEN